MTLPTHRDELLGVMRSIVERMLAVATASGAGMAAMTHWCHPAGGATRVASAPLPPLVGVDSRPCRPTGFGGGFFFPVRPVAAKALKGSSAWTAPPPS
jgi:hypothetical protein